MPSKFFVLGVVLSLALGAGMVAITKPRGIRNNNPGNIRRGSSAWQGLAPVQADAQYLTFTDMAYGVRAAGKLLRNYQANYGLNTVQNIITRWAPHSENPTDNYIQNVAKQLGVTPVQPLNLFDDETLYKMLSAIFRQENGGNFVDEMTIRGGIAII